MIEARSRSHIYNIEFLIYWLLRMAVNFISISPAIFGSAFMFFF